MKSAKETVAFLDDFNDVNDSVSKEPVRDVPASITAQLNEPITDDFNDFMEDKKPNKVLVTEDMFDDLNIDFDNISSKP